MRKALVIPFAGEAEVLDLDAPEGGLKVLQNAVGGWVQAIDINEKVTMWLNEEGKMIGLPRNPIATALWTKTFGPTDIMVGNAVITGGVDEEGETIGLTDEQVQNFQAIVALIN
jgi:hypothetical protein